MRHTDKRKHLSEDFVVSVRSRDDKLKIFEELNIKPNTFYQWASGMNKVSIESQIIKQLAERVGFEGSVFE